MSGNTQLNVTTSWNKKDKLPWTLFLFSKLKNISSVNYDLQNILLLNNNEKIKQLKQLKFYKLGV